MYITFEEYTKLYDPMDEKLFARLAFDACRVMDIHTTGIDNVKKLKRFFPTNEECIESVIRCAAKIINYLYQIQQAEIFAIESSGYETTEMGIRGKVISSVTAGNESISYATGGNASATAIDAAVKDKSVRNKLMADIVWEHLSGMEDSNGVNLLYMGKYPWRYL